MPNSQLAVLFVCLHAVAPWYGCIKDSGGVRVLAWLYDPALCLQSCADLRYSTFFRAPVWHNQRLCLLVKSVDFQSLS